MVARNKVRRTVFLAPETEEIFKWVSEQLRVYPGRLMSDCLDMVGGYMWEIRKDIETIDAGTSEGYLIRLLMRRALLGLSDILADGERKG